MSDEVLIGLAYLAVFLVLAAGGIAMWRAGKDGDE